MPEHDDTTIEIPFTLRVWHAPTQPGTCNLGYGDRCSPNHCPCLA